MRLRTAYLDDCGDDDFDAPVGEDERCVYQGHDPNASLSVVEREHTYSENLRCDDAGGEDDHQSSSGPIFCTHTPDESQRCDDE